jgi:hypothetical protein
MEKSVTALVATAAVLTPVAAAQAQDSNTSLPTLKQLLIVAGSFIGLVVVFSALDDSDSD